MSKIEVKLMLFDLDGTLIDSKQDLARSINLMLRDLGRPALDQDVIASFVGDGAPVLVRRALAATDPERKEPDRELHRRALDLMREHYEREMFLTTRLYPGVAETLAHFDSKPKAVVTSKETALTERILERFGIARHFQCIIGGDALAERKPDPKPLLEAASRLGGSASEAVMVGDAENDILAGKRAGAFTCAVSYGFRSAERLIEFQPDVLIDRFDQLKDFFC